MEFKCTDTNYTILINPSAWEKSLSSFSHSTRGDLHGLQTVICLINSWRSLCLWLPVFRAVWARERTGGLQLLQKTAFICRIRSKVTETCLTGCCSTNSRAQFNSLRLGSCYNTKFSGKRVFLLPCAVSELVGLMTRFASSWRAPNQSFSLEARFLSSLSVQARKEQSTTLSQEHQGKASPPQRVH